MFGPSGEDRPDVLTDAETVVLPVWLHRRPRSGGGATAEDAAAFLKSISVPAQPDEAGAEGEAAETAPETETNPDAETGAAVVPGAGEAGPAEGDPAEGHLASAAQDDPERAGPAEAKVAEAGTEAGVEADAETVTGTGTGTEAGGDAEAEPRADAEANAADAEDAGTEAGAQDAEAGARTEAGAVTHAAGDAQAGAEPAAPAQDGAGAEAKAAADAGAATLPAATRPDSETIITINLADLQAAARKAQGETTPQAGQAETDQATTVVTAPVPGQAQPGQAGPPMTAEATEATTVVVTPVVAKTVGSTTVEATTVEAIDALETRTIDRLEARTAQALGTVEAIDAIGAKTAQAMETIEAMTANALQAIDATAAEIAAAVSGEPGQAETPGPERTDSAPPDRAGTAGPSPGTDLAQSHVIRIDEPPASVTLTTSATETTIAMPHPRAVSTVAVAPAPAAPEVRAMALAPERSTPQKALPPAEPLTPPGAEPAPVRPGRRTWVNRGLLLGILCLQAVLSLRLNRTAFEDEALYLYSGHMELEHLLHGSALQGNYASYFSGAPVLYPVLAAAVNNVGGLAAVRTLSLLEMLATTAMLYTMTRRLFNERVGLCAAVLFSVTSSVIFLGNFATYDATCLFLLASAAWITVRTAAFRWPVFLLAAPVAALAVGVKYAGLLFVPTIAVLPALAGWPARGRRVLLYPLAFGAAVAGLLYEGLRAGGPAYSAAISQTTTNRAQGAVHLTTFLREGAEWGGVIFVLAVIGTVAYAWRARTEPEEHIGTVGGRFWRAALGAVLTGTALLAPIYQAHLHTDISFQKHIGFGLFFAAPIAGLGLSRILGDYLRHPHVGIAIWSVALVFGLTWSGNFYSVWPSSGPFVRTFSEYLTSNGRYLVEAPEVPIYYLENRRDAQPRQFYSTFYISYVNKKGVTLTGPAGYTAALDAGYFQTVAYYYQVTPDVDGVIAKALSTSHSYYLAAEIGINDSYGPGDYFVWVKGQAPKPRGLFTHASPRYQNLGTKLRELAP